MNRLIICLDSAIKNNIVKIIIIFCLLSKALFATAQNDSTGFGKVYFIRATGFIGCAAGFNVFVDSNFICKLNEKRYCVYKVLSGSHRFSVQFGGKKSKKVAEKIPIDVESGKSYYIEVVFQNGLLVNNVYCQEITENSAKTIFPLLKEDKGCAEEKPEEVAIQK